MSSIRNALCWSAAILFVAAGNALGWIADDAARTLFAVLPGLFAFSLGGRGRCLPWRSAEERGA